MNKDNKYILGIETSCDETAAAVVASGRHLTSNMVASQIDVHALYGGVVPEIASREHLKTIVPVVDQALKRAGISASDLSAVAVTVGPGLVGALLVGVSFAKPYAAAIRKPLIPVHHIEGHIASVYLSDSEVKPPFLCLVVSGGHSHLVGVEDYSRFRIIAKTRDDAPGEAFDKVARVLGLGYPGGPLIDKAAQGGDRQAFNLPQPRIENSLDFSFSGLKTAAIQQLDRFKREAKKKGIPWTDLCPLADFAATFQEAVAKTLVSHLQSAVEQTAYETIAIAGGVSANSRLRKLVQELSAEKGLKLVVPQMSLCTDNAAMVASAGYFAWKSGRIAGADQDATSTLDLELFTQA
ncbi:MAG: tRNA (adenosine(37)-N6)-threonylcarbamoyltransferase complex transferase subunit TsaD [Eubacteriales bacterium]|nr:tRNA (adenosine(37)-N6)-threonylcarbamoyltransferase complex transferase subunit TsaD [Eubacteriales bacterium]